MNIYKLVILKSFIIVDINLYTGMFMLQCSKGSLPPDFDGFLT